MLIITIDPIIIQILLIFSSGRISPAIAIFVIYNTGWTSILYIGNQT